MIDENPSFRLERFREHLERLFLREPKIFAHNSLLKNHPKIAVFSYENVPEEGYTTAITFGISEYENTNWIEGRPELCITVKSLDPDWTSVLGFIGVQFQSEVDFSYGEIIDLGEPISEESEMSAFFTFAPSIFSAEDTEINLHYYKINLVSLYPIYKEEINVIKKVGLKEFMFNTNYDMYSVNRPRITY